jgi:MoaA/NifB/PqqE/SkfB family radical SAM enzyme
MDSRFNPTEDKIWVMKCVPTDKNIGIKDMGYLIPDVDIDINPDLLYLGIDINNFCPAYWDLAYECAWELNPIHTEHRMWVVKFIPKYRKPKSWKWYGVVSPTYIVEFNPDIGKLNYDIDFVMPWYNFGYEHVWMLDNQHLKNNEDEMWAFKIKVTENPIGTKVIDYVTPTLTEIHNPDLPNIKYEIDYIIPWHDLLYEHVWYLTGDEKIWIVKLTIDNPLGTKDMGTIELTLPRLDVIFISYNESNAEDNWKRVLEKAPYAKRVDGVKGIFEAHKAAAKLAKTDMFYVVDGDAYLVDEWQFNFEPDIFDRDCSYVWNSRNPVNDLIYENGGVKLFPKKLLLKTRKWATLDMFTGVSKKIKKIDTVSNVTAFNTDEFSTWRSAFRECVKLYTVNQMTKLNTWLTAGKEKQYGEYAISGAVAGYQYATDNKDNQEVLININNYSWLKEQFNYLYPMLKNEKASVFNYKPIKIVNKEEIAFDPAIYTRLEHSNPEHLDWFVINWCLGNTCNFSCSYCPEDLHNASIKWPDVNVIKNFILQVKEAHPNKNLYFEFTGGEVTLYKHFIEVCKFCTEHGVKVGLISNGSRTLRYWEENKKYFDHVCLSFHPEESDEKHFIDVVKMLHDDVRTHVNIMMSPTKFASCYATACKVKNITNISMALQPLIHDFGDTMFEYTNPQKNIFDKQHELIVKHIKHTKEFNYYRGAMLKIYPDGQKQASSAQRFVSDKTNNWAGWKCYAGIEQLIVDKDGSIHRGWCKEGGPVGNIADKNLVLPTDPVLCSKTMCHCNLDIMTTKER